MKNVKTLALTDPIVSKEKNRFATGNVGLLGPVVGTAVVALGLVFTGMITPSSASAQPAREGPTATLLASGLAGGSGSTVGPDGALYVTEGAVGRISRVDPRTGEVTTFASGLPAAFVPRPGFNPD